MVLDSKVGAEQFLRDLTALSLAHGIAITGKPTLFLMEHEDKVLAYRIDDESNLMLG
jgi:hypothetical protein